MNQYALLVAGAALAFSSLCAVADGALRSVESAGAAGGAGAADAEAEPFARERAHRTLSFARLIAHLLTGAGFAGAFHLRDWPPHEALLMALCAATVAMVLAEAGARSLGALVGGPALPRLRRLLEAIDKVLGPVVVPAMRIEEMLQRRLRGRDDPGAEPEVTPEQFHQVIAAEAAVTRDEERLLNGVFSLGETQVGDVMVPRVDVVAIADDTPWSEVLDRVRSSEHARFPVYHHTIDEVIGVLYAKDLLPAVAADEAPVAGWTSLVRPPVFIPATKTIDSQLRDFKSSRTHIAIVVDEYGGTAGLVTIEDVLEEIVGDIRDEYDVEEPAIQEEEGKRFWVSGRVTLPELSEALGHDFSRSDVSTVGGLVYEMLGRVPRAGERLTLDNFRVIVERVRRRRVERVYFERVEALVGGPHA